MEQKVKKRKKHLSPTDMLLGKNAIGAQECRFSEKSGICRHMRNGHNFRFFPPYIHQLNGIAERLNRSIINMGSRAT